MTTVAQRITEQLAEHAVALPWERITGEAREATKRLFLDFLAVAVGGRRFAGSSAVILEGTRTLAGSAGGPSTIIGEPGRYPTQNAALANGSLVHSMDFDDTYQYAYLHPGAPIFATLLALAEAQGSSGAEFMTAAVVGYDVACKAGRVPGPRLMERGFHPTGVLGVFGATAAGARLLRLSREETLNALGINISQAAGTMQFLEEGRWTKRLHVGLSAHNAIYALTYARLGFQGSVSPFEGRYGLYNTFVGGDGVDVERAVAGLGSQFEVLGTAIKPYPCCRCSHSTIDAVLALKRAYGLTTEDVAGVEVTLSPESFGVVGYPAEAKRAPATEVAGQFSVYFAVAAALTQSSFTWQSYQLLGDPAVRELMQRVTARPDEEIRGYYGRVTITTRDGRSMTEEVPFPKGEPENPVGWEDLEPKVRSLAQEELGRERLERLIDVVRNLETVSDMNEVTALLRP